MPDPTQPMVLDFLTMPQDEMARYLNRLEAAYPEDRRFFERTLYEIRDDVDPHGVKAVMFARELFRLDYQGKPHAWYVCTEKRALMGDGRFEAHGYTAKMSLLKVVESVYGVKKPEEVILHTVKVDFSRPLDTSSAKFLAIKIPQWFRDWNANVQNKGRKLIEKRSGFDAVSHEVIDLTLSHRLILRKSSKYPTEYRLAIIGDLLGRGGYSQVYDNPATLRIGENGFFRKTERPRVARLTAIQQPAFPSRKGLSEEAIAYEDGLLSLMYHRLKAKPSFFVSDVEDPSKNQAICFERRLPGVPLRSMIADHGSDGIAHWIMESRLELAVAILRALDDQVHRCGLIHGDLKPDSIMVAESRPYVVNLINFNASHLRASQDFPKNLPYTPRYLAPECFHNQRRSVASDVYAMGITLAEMFGHRWPIYQKGDVESIMKFAHNYMLDGLFSNLTKFDKTHAKAVLQPEIARLLQEMVNPNPNARPSPLEAADRLEQILTTLSSGVVPDLHGSSVGLTV